MIFRAKIQTFNISREFQKQRENSSFDITGKDFKTKAERDQHMISCGQEPTSKRIPETLPDYRDR